MNEDRPRNWDWVSATHGCSALVMLSELKALARTNVKTRNEQLGEDRFLLMELDSVTFSVARAGEVTAQVWFKVTNDLLFPWLPGPYQPTSIALDGDVSWLPNSQTAVMDGNLEPGDEYQVTSSYIEPTPAELARMQRASQTNGNGWVHEEVEDRKEDEQ